MIFGIEGIIRIRGREGVKMEGMKEKRDRNNCL